MDFQIDKIAMVKWVDAFGCPAGWEFEDEALLNVSTVNSVGYVLAENEEAVMLVPHLSAPTNGTRRQLAGHIAIPRRQIITLTYLSHIPALGEVETPALN